MSTDPHPRRSSGMRRGWPLAVALVCSLASPSEAAIVRVTPATEVRSIHFRGVDSLHESQLRGVLRTHSRGSLHGLFSALGKLPLIPSPAHHEFRPRVLQEDVVRMREQYRFSGFFAADVRYEVKTVDEAGYLLDITFVVDEGPPERVVGVSVVAADSLDSLPVPPDQGKSWNAVQKRAGELAGARLDVQEVRTEKSRIQSWWRNRGYHEANVEISAERDSVQHEARLRFAVDPGPRRQFGPIEVEGNHSISEHTVVRELPFVPGDPYSDKAIEDARQSLQQLEIVRTAQFEVAASADSALPVKVKIFEAKPRLISGQLGYVTDAGLSAESQWSHRNLFGGARVFTVSGLAQTGWWSLASNPDIRYRGTVSLQHPYFFRRRLSTVVSPYVEYREDLSERSLEFGSNFTLIYRKNRLFTSTLDYKIATRDVYDYRVGELLAGDVDLLTFISQILRGDLLGDNGHVRTSLVTLSATAGTLDDFGNPRRGVLFRPSLQVTTPSAWATANYWKGDASLYAFAPLTRRTVLATRFTAGRTFPFGKSKPGDDTNSASDFLRLRDATFTAGGTADVRGWEYGLLGPKFPDLRVTQDGDSVRVEPAGGYVPLGGLQRASFTVELRMPFPALGPRFGSHVFVDGGRVWTSDGRYQFGGDEFDEERFFYAAGAGLDILTPVGSIRFSVGYKLNPSVLDLVDSKDLAQAIINDEPIDQLHHSNSRRFQFNLSFGTSY